jgi:hypothetical protein
MRSCGSDAHQLAPGLVPSAHGILATQGPSSFSIEKHSLLPPTLYVVFSLFPFTHSDNLSLLWYSPAVVAPHPALAVP